MQTFCVCLFIFVVTSIKYHLTSTELTPLPFHDLVWHRFDPAYLMEAPNLVELRVGSSSGFSLTTNFNFIKLQKLRVLVSSSSCSRSSNNSNSSNLKE